MWPDNGHAGWTPCPPQGPAGPGGLDAAKVDVVGEQLAVPGQGTALRWNHTWTLVPLMNQFWKTYVVNNALYLDRQVARWADAKLYLTDTSNVTHGPYRIYEPSDVMAIGQLGIACTNDLQQMGGRIGAKCDLPPLKSATLVYTIMGQPTGIGITAADGDLSDSSLIGISQNSYTDTPACQGSAPPFPDTCGSIYFYANTFADNGNVNYDLMWPQHVPHAHTASYTIGTRDQLLALGFGWLP